MSLQANSWRLCVTADPDSAFLGRVSDLLACLDLVPERLELRQKPAAADGVLLVTLRLRATARQADLLVRKLRQATLVHAIDCKPMHNGGVSV